MISIRLSAAIVLTIVAWQAPSRTAVYGSVGGIVTDQSGSAIPGAKLTLTNTAQGIPYRASTDSKGTYFYPSVPVGRYDLAVDAPGFEPQKRTSLVIDLDRSFTWT
jgi:Carboxypeptidase regulatory-like domain